MTKPPVSPHQVSRARRIRAPHAGMAAVRRFLAVSAVAAAGAACATTGERATGQNANRITAEELAGLTVSNAYDAVVFLRPRWLQPRSPRSERLSTEIIVAQGASYIGPVSVLRDIPLTAVRGFRYLDASEANAFIGGLGSRHVEGAIVIEFGAR